MKAQVQRPTAAFIGASWVALFIGAIAYLVGLWNAQMPLNEKGYYFTILMYGLFSAVSLQKSVRDQTAGHPRHRHLLRPVLGCRSGCQSCCWRWACGTRS